MFALTRLRAAEADVPALLADARALLDLLRHRPGFRDGAVGSSADEPSNEPSDASVVDGFDTAGQPTG